MNAVSPTAPLSRNCWAPRNNPGPAPRLERHPNTLDSLLPMKPRKTQITSVSHTRSAHSPRTRILLVDDDPTVRGSLNDVLLSEGYTVTPAENGQQAVDLANQSAFDLALLDLNMPVKNGWDTFEQLTREHPALSIIIVTARPNQLFTAASAGAGALMEKPMDIPSLLRAIKKLLAESPEKRLARLVGKKTDFYYEPATPRHDSRS
jgi:CheY-like chemotaxis protein